MEQSSRAAEGPLEPSVGRHPLDVVCLYSDDCRMLLSKGHHDPAAFRAAVELWNGGPLEGRWGTVRHGWHRTKFLAHLYARCPYR